MSRSIQVSLPQGKTDSLVGELSSSEGVVGISLHRGAALKPPGDLLMIDATNEGLHEVLTILANQDVGKSGSVLTSEPRSLVSPSSQDQIDQETNEASWPEMAALLRRETNLSGNYLMAMLFAGIVAAAGLWTDTVHIVVGAMVMAPGFEPIIRVPFGALSQERWSWRQGASSTAAGYAAMIIGAAAALLLLTRLDPSAASLGDRQWVQYWSSVKPSSVLIALAAGAAGAAIIAAQRSVLTAGVMIALALVPSASIVGMALASGDLGLAGNGAWRWLVDALCVVAGGGLILLLKRYLQHSGADAPVRQ